MKVWIFVCVSSFCEIQWHWHLKGVWEKGFPLQEKRFCMYYGGAIREQWPSNSQDQNHCLGRPGFLAPDHFLSFLLPAVLWTCVIVVLMLYQTEDTGKYSHRLLFFFLVLFFSVSVQKWQLQNSLVYRVSSSTARATQRTLSGKKWRHVNSVLTKIKEVTELLQGTFCLIFSFSFCEKREPWK